MNKNFDFIWAREIKELDSVANFYKHKNTGAEILSIKNDDENKVFGITFRTPPKDSTGVPHILEHSVLCGSKKYPVKEPFVELLKGSLQTFLNALTFPDKTSYPVASQNLTDFYNLIDVYLDAVFNPLLTKEIFMQEGWHLEYNKNNPEDSSIVGVVYNEMRGAYSSPDSLLMEYSQQSIFPENTYGFDSGGHPDEIINLTYEDFLDFHKRYYHPSNARIFFWGDDDEDLRLEKLEEYLSAYTSKHVDSKIAIQKRFSKPRTLEFFYPALDGSSAKSMITFNWLLEETSLLYMNFAFRIIENLLINMDSSVLKKALIESGLGEGICGVGLEQDLRQMYFSTGLKGVDPKNFDKVFDVIKNTLEDVYKNGFDKDLIEAAINRLEFDLRELNSGNLPRGLVVMFESLTTWLYDEDPLLCLCFEKPLNLIKEKLALGERIFEELVAKYFLNNTHMSVVKLMPDPKLNDQLKEKERQKVKKILSKIDSPRTVIQDLERLKRYQNTPSSKEALGKIPYVKIKDIEKREKEIPTVIESIPQGEILLHDIPTNNILYLDIAFDIKFLQQKYLGYVNILGRALTEMGTKKRDYVELDKWIQQKTGGIEYQTFIKKHFTEKKNIARFILRSKAMQQNIPDLFAILNEIFTELNLNNKERLMQILYQEKARMESALIPMGHRFVIKRLKSKLDSACWLDEQINGITYLLFLRFLIKKCEKNFDRVLEELEDVKEYIINSIPIILNITCKEDIYTYAKSLASDLAKSIGLDKRSMKKMSYQVEMGNEGICIPAQVNYVGKAMDLKGIGYKFNGSHLVVSRYLRNTYIWDKVRVEGGAYGGFVDLDRFSETLSFVSYRDPNCIETLKVYDNTSTFLDELNLDEKELEKAIIGTMSDIDTYMLPDEKGVVAMKRYLVGDTLDVRQRLRDEVLSCKKNVFKEFATILRELKDKGIIVVMGDKNKINELNTKGVSVGNIWDII